MLPSDIAPTVDSPVPESRSRQAVPALGWGMVPAGILAGVVGVFVLSNWGSPFNIPKELADLPATAAQEKLELKDRATRRVVCLNSSVSVALLAGIVAAALAACTSRRHAHVVAGVAVGAVVGGMCGAFGGAAGQLLLDRLRPVPVDSLPLMARAILPHLAVWILGGLGSGLAVGFSVRKATGVARPAFAGVLGGAVAALVYSPLGAIAFPLNETDRIVPTGIGNTLLWAAVTGGVIATVIVGLSSRPSAMVSSPK